MSRKNFDYRTICMFGLYNVYKVIVDEEGDVVNVGDPLLSKNYRSYAELLKDVECVLQNMTLSVVNINAGNKSLYGIR